MRSIYERALGGSDFLKLHPKIQERFGFNSQKQIASIGKGTMEKVWYGRFYTLPFLYLGTWRNIMFPKKGEHIPFTIENYAYRDRFGRETVTWLRKFYFNHKIHRFDATMIFSENRNLIVDYLGTHQHLAVDIDVSVAENGGLRLYSGEQRFYEGFLGFRFPMIFSGTASVCEWYDDDQEKFNIEVKVTNKIWGPLFGYKGSFDVEYVEMDSNNIPIEAKPLREEVRE
jgi:hypothetical protein